MAKKKGLSIFILDDTLIDQNTIKDFLTEFVFNNGEKIDIIQSFSLEDAEKQLNNSQKAIDLFILDGTLNPNHGYDLIPTIQKTNPTSKIVMCSGNSELNYKGVMKGADMDIPKGELGAGKSKSKQEDFAKELKDLLDQ